MPGGLVPPLRQPRPAGRIIHRLRNGGVTAGAAGIGEQAVTSVEQPQLSLLERHDVGDETGAGRLPSGPTAWELAGQYPLAERLGHHRCGVDETGQCDRRGEIAVCGRRGDAVHHGRHKADVVGNPLCQRRIEQGGEISDDSRCYPAVLGQVVAGHDGERAGVGRATGTETGHQPRRGGPQRSIGVLSQAVHIGSDVGRSPIQSSVLAPHVPGLGHRQGHHGDRRISQIADQCFGIGAGVGATDRADDRCGIAVGGPGDQRVQPVLCREGRGEIR